jgi:hypothetical protein
VDSLSLGFSHAILGRIRGKMKDKIFHLNKTPLTGCSTQNWFILILRELAINSKKDMGSRVPKTGEIVFCHCCGSNSCASFPDDKDLKLRSVSVSITSMSIEPDR